MAPTAATPTKRAAPAQDRATADRKIADTRTDAADPDPGSELRSIDATPTGALGRSSEMKPAVDVAALNPIKPSEPDLQASAGGQPQREAAAGVPRDQTIQDLANPASGPPPARHAQTSVAEPGPASANPLPAPIQRTAAPPPQPHAAAGRRAMVSQPQDRGAGGKGQPGSGKLSSNKPDSYAESSGKPDSPRKSPESIATSNAAPSGQATSDAAPTTGAPSADSTSAPGPPNRGPSHETTPDIQTPTGGPSTGSTSRQTHGDASGRFDQKTRLGPRLDQQSTDPIGRSRQPFDADSVSVGQDSPRTGAEHHAATPADVDGDTRAALPSTQEEPSEQSVADAIRPRPDQRSEGNDPQSPAGSAAAPAGRDVSLQRTPAPPRASSLTAPTSPNGPTSPTTKDGPEAPSQGPNFAVSAVRDQPPGASTRGMSSDAASHATQEQLSVSDNQSTTVRPQDQDAPSRSSVETSRVNESGAAVPSGHGTNPAATAATPPSTSSVVDSVSLPAVLNEGPPARASSPDTNPTIQRTPAQANRLGHTATPAGTPASDLPANHPPANDPPASDPASLTHRASSDSTDISKSNLTGGKPTDARIGPTEHIEPQPPSADSLQSTRPSRSTSSDAPAPANALVQRVESSISSPSPTDLDPTPIDSTFNQTIQRTPAPTNTLGSSTRPTRTPEPAATQPATNPHPAPLANTATEHADTPPSEPSNNPDQLSALQRPGHAPVTSATASTSGPLSPPGVADQTQPIQRTAAPLVARLQKGNATSSPSVTPRFRGERTSRRSSQPASDESTRPPTPGATGRSGLRGSKAEVGAADRVALTNADAPANGPKTLMPSAREAQHQEADDSNAHLTTPHSDQDGSPSTEPLSPSWLATSGPNHQPPLQRSAAPPPQGPGDVSTPAPSPGKTDQRHRRTPRHLRAVSSQPNATADAIGQATSVVAPLTGPRFASTGPGGDHVAMPKPSPATSGYHEPDVQTPSQQESTSLPVPTVPKPALSPQQLISLFSPRGGEIAPIQRTVDDIVSVPGGDRMTSFGRLPVGGAPKKSSIDVEAIDSLVAAAIQRHVHDTVASTNTNAAASGEAQARSGNESAAGVVTEDKDSGDSGGRGAHETDRVGLTEVERMIQAIEERVLRELDRRGGRFAGLR